MGGSLGTGGAELGQPYSEGRNVFPRLRGELETEDGQGHFVGSYNIMSITNTFPYVI